MATSRASEEDPRRFLTFRLGERLYALPAREVSEVIRMPALARLPQAPPGLLGLANLRGTVLPVASLRRLVGMAGSEADDTRALVLDAEAPCALAVDSVEALVHVAQQRIETRQIELTAQDGEVLRGAFAIDEGGEIARILDVRRLLSAAFVPRPRDRSRTAPVKQQAAAKDLAGDTAGGDAGERLVTFEVAGQEFALPLACVEEIIAPGAHVAIMPRTEAVVLGVSAYRDGLLTLLSLRGLLGLPAADERSGREKIVVTRVGAGLAGLVVDRMRAILSADPALVEATPAMLAARMGGESRIRAIYRSSEGARLVSILSPDLLFREDVMQRLEAGPRPQFAAGTPETEARPLQLLVFRLAGDEFGLPVEAVEEIARVPEEITRVPRTPKFLEGVFNLRGDVLPIIDQRRRFDMPPAPHPGNRRLVVVRAGRHRAGLIVDGVSEVLRTRADAVEPAPDLAGDTTRLVQGVVNVEATGRMVLLLDAAELLTRSERGLLDAMQKTQPQAPT